MYPLMYSTCCPSSQRIVGCVAELYPTATLGQECFDKQNVSLFKKVITFLFRGNVFVDGRVNFWNDFLQFQS